jgi:hypothetical protein
MFGSGPMAPTLTYWQTSTAAKPPALTTVDRQPGDHDQGQPGA